MILLVGRAPVSPEELAWVSRETGMELYQALTLQEASERLRGAPCRIVVLDSGLLETEAKGIDRLLAEIPSTPPIFPNLAICGPERLVCEIKAALRRSALESERAHEQARTELRSHLKDCVTAFLLTCDLALQASDLPNQVGQRILLLHDLATKMRELLGIEIGQATSA